MAARRIHLVGEPFENFADGIRVTTPKRLFADLAEHLHASAETVELVAGQGLTEEIRTELSQQLSERDSGGSIRTPQWSRPRPAAVGTCKENTADILVADLKQSGDGEFTAALSIHPDNVMLIDRDNGARHVAGMLEVEACLQMAMAVTARYLTPPDAEYAFVTATTTIRFLAFLFPLPATLTLRVNEVEDVGGKYLELDLLATISQAGRPTMTMAFQSRAFDVAVLRATERTQLNRALEPDRTDAPAP